MKKEFLDRISALATVMELEFIEHVLIEVRSAESKHPDWPKDRIHQIAIVSEESGEAVQAVLDEHEGKKPHHGIMTEIIQTAAMCVRFAKNFK